MGLTRVSNGLLISDDFNNSFNPLWDIFPNGIDRVLFNEDSIALLPKGGVTEMLMPSPGGRFIIQTEIEYNPESVDDYGGVIIKSVTGNNAECKFEYDGEQNEYRFLQIYCDDYYVVNLKASKDGIDWDDFGNTKFYDGNFIGYYVGGSSSIEIKRCTICTDKYVVIQGVTSSDSVKLIDASGEDLTSSSKYETLVAGDKMLIDIGSAVWPIRDISISINNNDVGHIEELYGGDVFSFGPELMFSVDGVNESSNGFELGEVNGRIKNYTLRVFNNSDKQKLGKLVIDPISSYDNGHQMAYIYPIDSDFNYNSKELEVAIGAAQEFSCIVRIVKDSKYITIDDDFKFNILFIQDES